MRTWMFFGALSLAGCASPEAAFPRLADLEAPPAPDSTPIQRQGLLAQIQAAGDATREAGRMVQGGEISSSRLPR